MGKYGIYNAQPFQYENPTTPNFLGATDFSRFSNKPPGQFALDTLQVPGQVALVDSLHSAPADSQQIAIPETPQPPRRREPPKTAIIPSLMLGAAVVATAPVGFAVTAAVVLVGGGILYILPPTQEAIEFMTMEEIYQQELMDAWSDRTGLSANDFIQLMLPKPGDQLMLAAPEEPVNDPPPDWAPPELFKKLKKRRTSLSGFFHFYSFSCSLF